MALLGNVLRVLNNLKDELPKDTITTHVQSKFATGGPNDDFSHIYKRKTRFQMCLISACVCGIEFCYAAETAFVTPILLQIGVPVLYMTMVWCLSPLLGIFLVPLLGSLSDRCPYKMGRRRPFILLLSTGVIIGLILVPEGKSIGKLMGDVYEVHRQLFHFEPTTVGVLPDRVNSSSWMDASHMSYSQPPPVNSADKEATAEAPPSESRVYHPHPWSILFTVVGVILLDVSCDACQSPCRAYMLDVTTIEDHPVGLSTFTILAGLGGSLGYVFGGIHWGGTELGASFGSHVRVVFTIVMVLYLICLLLTVTSIKEIPLDQLNISQEDIQVKKKRKDGRKYHKFTNDDDDDAEDEDEGYAEAEREKIVNNGEVKRYGLNQTSLSIEKTEEIQLELAKPVEYGYHDSTLEGIQGQKGQQRSGQDKQDQQQGYLNKGGKRPAPERPPLPSSVRPSGVQQQQHLLHQHPQAPLQQQQQPLPSYQQDNTQSQHQQQPSVVTQADPRPLSVAPIIETVSLKTYLKSIVKMPRSLFILCLTNLFSWMSLLSYSLFFTNFVGQAVFGGDPNAPEGSPVSLLYNKGVRTGSFGMALYSLSCSVYSLSLESLINKFGARKVYILSQLVYTVGSILMAITRHRVAVIVLSPTAGIMYATLFTMPYVLVAKYHSSNTFHNTSECSDGEKQDATSKGQSLSAGTDTQVRGLGTDVALVSSMVFVAQFLLSSIMGTIIHYSGTTVAVIVSASVLSACGAICATQVLYLDL